jgi:hypothetical protein
MSIRSCLCFLPVLMLAGCVHKTNNSGTAAVPPIPAAPEVVALVVPLPPPAVPPPPPKATHVTLRMLGLCCGKTTEPGADEAYLFVAGLRSDNTNASPQQYSARLPDANDPLHRGDVRFHWDINDGGQPDNNPSGDSHCIRDRVLFEGDLPEGQSWDFSLIFMEEDGGNSALAQDILAGILMKSGDPYAATAGGVLGVMTALGVRINDTDDYLGSFSLRIKNSGGKLTVDWKSIDRINYLSPSGNYAEVKMNGDGSDYITWIRVD